MDNHQFQYTGYLAKAAAIIHLPPSRLCAAFMLLSLILPLQTFHTNYNKTFVLYNCGPVHSPAFSHFNITQNIQQHIPFTHGTRATAHSRCSLSATVCVCLLLPAPCVCTLVHSRLAAASPTIPTTFSLLRWVCVPSVRAAWMAGMGPDLLSPRVNSEEITVFILPGCRHFVASTHTHTRLLVSASPSVCMCMCVLSARAALHAPAMLVNV